MKKGKSIQELAAELTRINESKRDYIVPVSMMKAVSKNDNVAIEFTNGETKQYGLTNWSGSQLATYTDIPKAYFDRISAENPSLAANNINHGLSKMQSDSRMLRTLDGNLRGLVSPKFRILDGHDLVETTLPVAIENGLTMVSSDITPTRLFMKFLSPKLEGEIKKGDVVRYGLTVSTSDVGAGSVRIEPLIFRLACLNGMISSTAFRKYHVGQNKAENEVFELLSDRTKEMTDATFWAQVRDVILASLKPENFQREIDKLRVAANEPILNFDLPRVVELTMKATSITGEKKAQSILAALASGNEGAGLTRWGLINSFTRAAQSDDFSYEESIELERAAGNILELPKNQWQTIAAVAA